MNEIYEQAYLLAEEIKQTDTFKKMKELNEYILKHYDNEVKNYQKTFHLFEEAHKIGKNYYPDYQIILKNHQEAKISLYEKEEVKTYFILENQINDWLSKVSKDLLKAVSNYIEVKGAFCSWK